LAVVVERHVDRHDVTARQREQPIARARQIQEWRVVGRRGQQHLADRRRRAWIGDAQRSQLAAHGQEKCDPPLVIVANGHDPVGGHHLRQRLGRARIAQIHDRGAVAAV
jgi:hypothetical protein